MPGAFLRQKLTPIITLVTALFIYTQYLDARWTSRIERSLELLFIYQNKEKNQIRNAINLTDEFTDPVQTRCAKTDNVIFVSDVYKQDDLADLNDLRSLCAKAIYKYVDEEIGTKKVGYYSLNTREFFRESTELSVKTKRILELSDRETEIAEDISVREAIRTEEGIVVNICGSLWWYDGQANYRYSWPAATWKYFSSLKADGPCDQYVKKFALNLKNKKIDGDSLEENVHSLKHFFASVSVCTVSGVCDAFVACQAFNREIGTFVAEWGQYFELWGAREKKFEFPRLQNFINYCSSNVEYEKYSSLGVMSIKLYLQQLFNVCWEVDGKGAGPCEQVRRLLSADWWLGLTLFDREWWFYFFFARLEGEDLRSCPEARVTGSSPRGIAFSASNTECL